MMNAILFDESGFNLAFDVICKITAVVGAVPSLWSKQVRRSASVRKSYVCRIPR